MSDLPELTVVPVRKHEMEAWIKKVHRHHAPPQGYLFTLGVIDDEGQVRGMAVVGRAIARNSDSRTTAEITRVATDGCPNAGSALYGAARRAAFAMGYTRIQTYTLPSESGSSLRGAGFVLEEEGVGGGDWGRDERPRDSDHPKGEKLRWACERDVSKPNVKFDKTPIRPEVRISSFD